MTLITLPQQDPRCKVRKSRGNETVIDTLIFY